MTDPVIGHPFRDAVKCVGKLKRQGIGKSPTPLLCNQAAFPGSMRPMTSAAPALALIESEERFSPQLIEDVRDHYDTLSPLYRAFWGEHLHHGFWRGNESAHEAQENLVKELAARARITEGERVLDVGCGLGRSAMFLAREYEVMVRGISLSAKQVSAARDQARRRGLLGRVNFDVQDAHHLDRDPGIYDVIWIVECSEHLFRKPAFIRECARHLAPGGRLAICAWLLGEHLDDEQEKLVEAVRLGMLCPSFGTLADYAKWLLDAGLEVESAEDVTPHVARTWSVSRTLLDSPLVKTMLAVGNAKLSAFADSFAAIDEAYRCRAMGYGMFVASRPVSR
jgi:tocopherol O-methyltransferase